MTDVIVIYAPKQTLILLCLDIQVTKGPPVDPVLGEDDDDEGPWQGPRVSGATWAGWVLGPIS